MPKAHPRTALMKWYRQNRRNLPWRSASDPYKIWLSEIILQQTRVAQGLAYYEKFVAHYPKVENLAKATENQVLKDWEGLGYYSRARNLHNAAKQITNDFGGKFPDNYEAILALKGVGPYTAAAISSFAFGLPKAVVDGNVQRVLSRFLGIETPINSSAGQKIFQKKADEWLDLDNPGDHNQAMMEFGALQCVPKKPDCGTCPLQENCVAFSLEKVTELPFKVKKNYDRHRFFQFYILKNEGKTLVEQRAEKDIWKGLFQFPNFENDQFFGRTEFLTKLKTRLPGAANLKIEAFSELKPHKLSHQTIHIQIFEISGDSPLEISIGENQKLATEEELDSMAFPRPLRAYLQRNQLLLPLV